MKFLFLVLLVGILSSSMATAQPTRWDKFRETSLTACTPEGWLREFLYRQQTGLTGHPEVLSYPFNSCLWAGIIQREDEQRGDNWWRYEQTAYYSDALLRLGYLLNDTAMVRIARAGIDYTLAHAQKNGRLGPDLISFQWPIAIYFRALQAEYLATGDQRIIEALHRHYLSYTPDQLGKESRNIVNIEGALFTYGKTNDRRLLELAEKAYALGEFELNMNKCLSNDTIIIHGVTYMEYAKLPAILYIYTGKKEYLNAAINAMRKLDRDHMLPDGVPSSNEFLSGKDPLQSHETCDITDYTWSLGYLLMATGDAVWADKIEKAVFNAGPGAISKDFKNFQYFSSVNQVIATGNSNHNKYFHGSTWMAYWPCNETECCAGNVNRFMPNYVARMWMRDAGGAPVAALFGPSVEKVALENGKKMLTITETTDYPFSGHITFKFDIDKPETLPFSFRVPSWCRNASVTVNGKAYPADCKPGSFVTIKRRVAKGDRIVLRLPMSPKPEKWGNWGDIVGYGPLLYAYAVPEKVTVDTNTYANLGSKRSTDPNFPALDLRPNGPWNYALAIDERKAGQQITVVRTGASAYPFDPHAAPVVLKVPARRVKNWQLVESRYTPPLPAAGKFECEQRVDTITLEPYGSTRLRVSVFPVCR